MAVEYLGGMLSIPGDLDDFRSLIELATSSSVIIASVDSFFVALIVLSNNSDDLQLYLFNSLKRESNFWNRNFIRLGI